METPRKELHGNIQVKASRFEQIAKKAYRRFVFPCIRDELHRQRLKLLWFIWDYWPIVVLKNIPFFDRLKLLKRFLRIDWNIAHSHLPSEFAIMCTALTGRKAKFDEVVVEAGSWRGGSAAKLSIVCKMLGYRLFLSTIHSPVLRPPLLISKKEKKYRFLVNMLRRETMVRDNLYTGEPEVCSIVKGWFKDTLAKAPIPHPVRMAYIDCDLLKGTEEALTGLVPSLVEDGYIFSEDYHIQPVRNLLCKPGSLERFGKGPMVVTALGHKATCERNHGMIPLAIVGSIVRDEEICLPTQSHRSLAGRCWAGSHRAVLSTCAGQSVS